MQDSPPRIALAAFIVLYLLLAIATALTMRPWCDEAWFADPAYSLMHTGRLATPVLEPTGNYRHPTGIQEYTYWIMPLHSLVQVPWYAIFGFSFPSLRLLSVLWGLLGLAAVYDFVRGVSGKPTLAAIALALLACDFVYINAASAGRMDMMSAALVFGALALYVRLRDAAPRRAIFTAHTLIAAAAFTHPVGGMVGLAALLALSMPDLLRRKLDHLIFGVPPYLLFALAWGAYISRRPDYFAAQFFSNTEGRFTDLANPVRMLVREAAERYAPSYGLASYSSAAALSKLYILAFYLICSLALLLSGRLRARVASGRLLAVCGVSILALMIVDSTRQAYYLVYTVVPLAILTAAFLYAAWAEYARLRPLLAIGVVLLVGVQLATLASRIRSNPMGRGFQSVVAFLHRNYSTRRIDASAEICMALDFPANAVDDPSLGYYTHRVPDAFVVEDVGYQQFFNGFQKNSPEVHRYIVGLRDQYARVYDFAGYQVYARR